MRRALAVAAAVLALVFSAGCSMRFTVPDVSVAIEPPQNPQKIPLKAAVLVPDENEMTERTFHIADFSYTFDVPTGKMVKKSSLEIFPHYFDKAAIVKNRQEAEGFDLLFVPTLTNFGFDSRGEGMITQHVQSRVTLKAVASDPQGVAIWEKTVTSPWSSRVFQGLSTDEWLKQYGMAILDATAAALKETLRGMTLSLVFKDYLAARGGTATVAAAAAPEPPATSLPSRSDAFAVVIGIDYRGRNDVPALRYASQDARKVYGVLTDPRYGGVPKENALLLLNEKATRNELIAAFRKIKTWPGYLYIYYSGYGAPKTEGEKFQGGLIVPHDAVVTDPDALEDTSISLTYLRDLVDASQAKGILIALDAGFTGGGKSVLPKGGKPLVGMLAAPELLRPKGAGRVIITSSAVNQTSWEDDTELKGGIFSHFLLEGMKGKSGKDPWVKVDQLAGYLKENVPEAARRLKGAEQVPQITGSANFAVTRNWERAQATDAEIARSKLKGALEKGFISAAQVSRAMGELASPKRSKTLDAFLQGRLDEKQFGELY